MTNKSKLPLTFQHTKIIKQKHAPDKERFVKEFKVDKTLSINFYKPISKIL